MSLIFLRHTQPDVESGLCYGATDLNVATSFASDAEATIARLPHFDRILTSPLRRCSMLAEKISIAAGIAFSIDKRLTEIDFGSWEMRAWSDIPRAELDDWAHNFAHARPHGGESIAQLKSRVSDLIEALKHEEGSTLLVTHAGVIKTAFAADLKETSHRLETGFGCYHVREHPQAASKDDSR